MMVTITLARQVAVLLIGLMMTTNSEEAKKKKMRVFDGKCYWTDGTTNRYSGAVAECQKEGGKLATFEDDSKVKKAAKALNGLVGNNQFWIGLRYGNGKWQWEGSTENELNNPYISLIGDGKCASAQLLFGGKTMIYIPSSCITSELLTLCCKEDTTGCTGDPHFFISSSDADNTHLCFEVDGRDGDVLVLVQDSDLDLQVNGELFASKVEEFNKAFFSAIAVLCGDDEIIATKDHITINGLDIVDWDETYSVDLMNEGTVTSYDHSSARINLESDVQLEVTRSHTVNNETYLGFFITHAGALGDGTTGVIGKFIGSKFTAFPTIDSDSDGVVEFSELPITIPVHRVTRYSRSHREQIECWHYNVDSDARDDVLLGRRAEYTVDELRNTLF